MVRMRPTNILAAAVLIAGSLACGDTVVTKGQTYSNVKVVNFTYGTLQFMDGKVLRKVSLKDLGQLTLDGQELFNQAEQLRAEGKYADAVAQYAQARKKAAGQWRFLLFKARGEQTAKLGGVIIKPRPGGGDDQEPKLPPLSSLDALAADLATEPLAPKDRENWANLDERDRKEANEKYQQELAAWKKSHDYKDAKVSWVMKPQNMQEGDDGKVTVEFKSEKGFPLTAECAKLDDPIRQAISAKRPLAVVGTIKEYTIDLGSRSDSFFDTSMIRFGLTVSPAQLYLPEKAPKPTTTQSASSRPADK